MKKSVKKLADAKNPTIEAVINELFKFKEEAGAVKRIGLIKSNFVISKTQSEDEKSLRLWVRGFALSDEEKKQGQTGNFALVSYYKNDQGKFTLRAAKEKTELKFHPEKIRPKKSHPDWNHVLLKPILTKKVFKNKAEADALFESIHEEFPDISIPAVNKLYIMIYQKADPGTSPVQKYVLEIKAAENDGCRIEYNLNEERKKFTPQPPTPDIPPEAKGKFTTMVELRRKKKRK